MKRIKISTLLIASILVLSACGEKSGDDQSGVTKNNVAATEVSASAAGDGCKLVSTKDDSPLNIVPAAEDSEHAKTFLATCKNPYTKLVIEAKTDYDALIDAKASAKGDEMKALKEKIKMNLYGKGKKLYGLNNCTGCHGGKLEGVMAPGLRKQPSGGQSQFDNVWVYPKNATDKGMFETIAGGTLGNTGGLYGPMFVWHKQLEGHTGSGLTTDEILQTVAYIRAEYAGEGPTPWLD